MAINKNKLWCHYGNKYGGVQYAKNRFAWDLYERPCVTIKTVSICTTLSDRQRTVIDALEDEGIR